MKQYILFLFLLLLLWGGGSRSSTAPQGGGQAEEPTYNKEAALTFRSRTLDRDTSVRVYMELDVKREAGTVTLDKFVNDFSFIYYVQADYNGKEVLYRRGLKPTTEAVRQTGPGTFGFTFEVPKLNVPTAVLFLEVTDASAGQKLLHDILLEFKPTRMSDSYALFGPKGSFPHLRSYFSTDDTLRIADLKGTAREMVVTRYAYDFEPAASPMGAGNRNAPKVLPIDTTFTLRTNQMFQLVDPGLYLFREDTSQVQGMGVLITDDRYPRLTYPQNLLKPLIYISTRNEIKEISNSNAPKRTLDNYWLRLASNNEGKARRTIRAYYRRVATANQLFTTYKEGWKTDMGMIYVVLGPPDQVARTKEKEVWTYTQNPNFSEINFTFVRKPNQFVEDHYELVRYPEYEPIWYPIVEEWRSGVVER
jgi:GWxTD domain-containing protein